MSDPIETQEPPVDTGLVKGVFDRLLGTSAEPVLKSAEPAIVVREEVVPPVTETVKTDKVETPVTETKVEPIDDLPESLPNEGRSEKWKQFRTQYNDTKKELLALKSQQSDFEGTRKERDELKAQIAQHEEKIKKLSEIDSVARLQNDPDFHSKYDAPRDEAVTKLKELAGYSDIDPDELVSVLKLSGKDKLMALNRLVESAPMVVQGKIVALVDKVADIEVERANELKDAQTSLERRVQERHKAQTEARTKYEQEAKEIFNRTSASLAKELGIDEATINKARDVFEKNNDLEVAAKLLIKGMAAEGALGKGVEKDKRIAELESELSKYRESSPGVSAGASGTGAPKEMSFMEAIKQGAREARVI